MSTTDDSGAGRTAQAGQDLEVHRLLDDAFAGFETTPDRQDLKEELRASLVSRVAELRARGVDAATAARQAFADLGDVRAAIAEVEDADRPPRPDDGIASSPGQDWTKEWARNRVRPRPAFVVACVLLGAVAAGSLAVLALSIGPLDVARPVRLPLGVLLAFCAGALTTAALRQETTTNHPMPPARAAGYGLGALLGVEGLGLAREALDGGGVGWLVGGALLVLAAAAGLTWLLGTQTNRHKAWALRAQASQAERSGAGDRFTEDPDAAARFGIYTVVTWVVAGALFVALTLTVGWQWSWLALVGGFAAMMIVLARMLFGPR